LKNLGKIKNNINKKNQWRLTLISLKILLFTSLKLEKHQQYSSRNDNKQYSWLKS
jgi:hypothetical protein